MQNHSVKVLSHTVPLPITLIAPLYRVSCNKVVRLAAKKYALVFEAAASDKDSITWLNTLSVELVNNPLFAHNGTETANALFVFKVSTSCEALNLATCHDKAL